MRAEVQAESMGLIQAPAPPCCLLLGAVIRAPGDPKHPPADPLTKRRLNVAF